MKLTENDDSYFIYAFLPKMTKDQVKVKYTEDNVLTVAAEKESNGKKKECKKPSQF